MNRQSVLMEALPYIRKFHGKTIVIKLGGHAMVDPKIMNTVIEDAVLLHYVGMRVVLVHGGGPENLFSGNNAGEHWRSQRSEELCFELGSGRSGTKHSKRGKN